MLKKVLLIAALLPCLALAQGIQTPPNAPAAVVTRQLSLPQGSLVCLDYPTCSRTISWGGSSFSISGTTGFSANVTIGGGLRWTTASSLGTCSSSTEGYVYRMTGTGGTNTSLRTRFCLCTSDGAASPTYAWMNLVSGTVGNSTTCNA